MKSGTVGSKKDSANSLAEQVSADRFRKTPSGHMESFAWMGGENSGRDYV